MTTQTATRIIKGAEVLSVRDALYREAVEAWEATELARGAFEAAKAAYVPLLGVVRRAEEELEAAKRSMRSTRRPDRVEVARRRLEIARAADYAARVEANDEATTAPLNAAHAAADAACAVLVAADQALATAQAEEDARLVVAMAAAEELLAAAKVVSPVVASFVDSATTMDKEAARQASVVTEQAITDGVVALATTNDENTEQEGTTMTTTMTTTGRTDGAVEITARSQALGYGWEQACIQEWNADYSHSTLRVRDVERPTVQGSLRAVEEEMERAARNNQGNDWKNAFFVGGKIVDVARVVTASRGRWARSYVGEALYGPRDIVAALREGCRLAVEFAPEDDDF